jgi:hypothetical protein
MTKKERFIEYRIRQKPWWNNMDRFHRNEENTINFAHLLPPKLRIDRVASIKGCRLNFKGVRND